jgi:hypothetical protein
MKFVEIINRDFAGLIRKYNLSNLSQSTSSVQLENDYCVLELHLERGVEFFVTFIDKNTNRKYELMNLVFFRGLQNREKINANGLFDLHAKEIEMYFSDLLLGDFNWSSDYDLYMKRYT